MEDQDLDAIVGCTDGFKKGYIEGWAWRPNRPHDTVVVQLLVDGVLAGEVSACLPRPDLSAAGIGHGQHAFAIPLMIKPDSPPMLRLTVRAKDGPILPAGEIDFATSEETRTELAQRRSTESLEKVFGPLTSNKPQQPRQIATDPLPQLNFILYAARGHAIASAVLGAPEYSYVFVMHGFRELLRQIGIVHVVQDPAAADSIFETCLEQGESCLLFSFTPPQNAPLGLRCPMIPVIAWEFGSIPIGGWPGDPREDWRYVLRQTGRAITISNFAAKAIRAGLGADYPVIFAPTPVWDRQAGLRARLSGPGAIAPGSHVTLAVDGFTWDSRCVTLSSGMRTPPPPFLTKKSPGTVLPMRGAQLALAEASAAEQRNMRAMRAGLQPAQLFESKSSIPAEPPLTEPASTPSGDEATADKGLRRLRYRDIARNVLPSPVVNAIRTLRRTLLESRPRLFAPIPASAISVGAGGRTSSSPLKGDVYTTSQEEVTGAIGANRATEVIHPPSSPTGLYLPVGNPESPESNTAPPRYLPAQDRAPLPESELAAFTPDPFPSTKTIKPERDTATLDGLVFTAVLSPKDGRKNWQDILTAFATAFRDTAEATLVLKMIGPDPAFWWWEFHDIVKALPEFSCRVIVINGFLDKDNYEKLIAATHFIVNASLAEGQCLPLVEFMSAGTPAIAPFHTAMLDYLTPQNALIIDSDAEFCSFPHDPRNMLTTTRYRIDWLSLCTTFKDAAHIIKVDQARYVAMAESASASMRLYCSNEAVGKVLASFLGFGDEVVSRAGWTPQPREAAEPLLVTNLELHFLSTESVS